MPQPIKVNLLSYATNDFSLGRRLLNFSSRLHGVNQRVNLRVEDLLKTQFYEKHKHILDQPRGAGYWLWKPYFILETLKQMQDGEVLIYSDCGQFFRKNIAPLTTLTKDEKGVVLFYNWDVLSRYCKRDVFVAMECDSTEYHKAPLIHANLQIYRKCEFAISFLEEVLHFATQNELITDAPNTLGLPNLPDYIDHRHDQSITSLLAHKRGLTLYLDPTQFKVKNANFEFGRGDLFLDPLPYQSVVYVHRYRNKQIARLIPDLTKKIFKG